MRRAADKNGFTLLEILVVLLLMGLLVSIAIPGLVRTWETVSYSYRQSRILDQISSLGYRAMQEGREIVFPASGGDKAVIDLPEDWRIESDTPITYQVNGVCLGGKIGLGPDNHIRFFLLKPPLCVPHPL